jgi:tRNA nucleotidyltransferase (CCA-adding enzyme)
MNLSATLPPSALRLAEAIIAAGGSAVLVGGAVRDALLGLAPKDIDIEAYGLPVEALQAALERVASVHAVGKSFGVLKARIAGMDIDVSLPRREKKVGLGHRGFAVDHDPSMPFAEAASRRDFTINAIGVDFRSGEILDPWGGRADLQAGLIRHVSDAFDEDPLRVLRACQFSARFGFPIAEETLRKCRSLQAELATLSTERIWEEFKKLLLKSPKPSTGMAALEATGALALFPELSALRGAGHNPVFHPEGDVWTHNNLVLDACALLCRDEKLDEKDALLLLLASLCHDLGKPATARLMDGVWRNPGHELAGEAPARSLLARIGCPPSLAERVVPLVREHGQAYRLCLQDQAEPVADGVIRRLALRVPILPLCRLAVADFQGRTAEDAQGPCFAADWLKAKAAALGVLEHAPKPLLQGRDAQALGVKPGPAMGELLKAAFEAQLDGEFADLPGAVAWARLRLSNASP